MAKKTNFGDKRNTAGFDKNPQNINRKGRLPTKSLASFVKNLERKGYEAPTYKTVASFFGLLLSMPISEWQLIHKDDNSPALARMIIQMLKTKNERISLDALKMSIEHAVGKPREQLTVKEKIDKQTVDDRITMIIEKLRG